MQTFVVNSRPPLLYQHVTAKHPDLIDNPAQCFTELVRYDPNDPKGEKAAAAAKAAPKKKSKAKKGNIDDLDTLLDVGLKKK